MMKKWRIKSIVKKCLYQTFFYSRIFDILLYALRRVFKDHPCIILLYHRIVDDHSEYLNKGPVMHHHIKHFKREISYLKRNYQILSIDEVVDHLRSGKRFSKPSIAITFDDGYLDNYALAYPVLEKYRVPAMIYITTGVMGTSKGTWPDQIEYALLETNREEFNLHGLFNDEIVKIKTRNEKEQANIKITEALKLQPDFERKQLMEELFKNLRVDINDVNNKRARMMLNGDEIKEMARNGITIGSHSHTHPILSRMPLQKAKEDIFISKKIIEENLDIKVKHFAYPNGRAEDFSEELRNYCQEIGFESVAALIHGTNDPLNGNAFALKRIGVMSPVWILAGDLIRLLLKRSLENSKRSINTNALNKVTSPPPSPSPSPHEGEGWMGGKRNYCVCISR